MKLEIGKKAPSFKAKLQDGSEVSSNGLKGNKYVLYFYPKDDTPTCTKQACNIRDNYSQFQDSNIHIYGVSPDGEKSHLKFKTKYDLPFQLIMDEDQALCEKFGVWGEKKNFGRTYMGVKRTTFVIDENGKIADIITKVKADNHTEQIFESL